MQLLRFLAVTLTISATALTPAHEPATSASARRTSDIVYDRQDGTALTMDEFAPAKPNGHVVLSIISGGWYSAHAKIDDLLQAGAFQPFLERGYKVYAVVHRSSPRFSMEEAYADVIRAIRFVRHREAEDGNTSASIAVVGASAGGHLALLAGTTGDDGDPSAADPVARQPSRIQAVACLFPPTDLLNYGDQGVSVIETFVGKHYYAAIVFRRQPDHKLLFLGGPYADVTDETQQRQILKQMSPITHVTSDDAPTLIVHGDNDTIVPLEQSERMAEALTSASVKNELHIRKGKGHGWAGIPSEFSIFARWIDKNLRGNSGAETAETRP